MIASIETLIEQVEHQISRTQLKRYRSKKFFYVIAISQAFLAGSVTVILGLTVSSEIQGATKNIALIVSGLANIMALVYAILKPKEKLMLYTKTASELKAYHARLKILREINSIDSDEILNLFEEFQNILSNSNRNWQLLMKKKPEKHDDHK